MATILKGAPVVAAMNERNAALCEQLKAKGITPTLAVVRVGEREDDLSYERGVMTRCGKVGVAVKQFVLPADATQEQLLRVLNEVNTDDGIHGCLLFRPLPKQFDDRTVRAALRPEKDIDGITDGSLAGVFTNTDLGYAPCTAQACMEILKYYNVPLSGKRAIVVGRSLVVGKPAAMMLDRENATVTLCNSRTRNLPELCKQADIVVVAMGKMAAVGADCLRAGQTVVDVGIHVNEEGKLYGDVQYAAAEPVVDAITPVPGGVGTVTTSVLVGHVVQAACKKAGVECSENLFKIEQARKVCGLSGLAFSQERCGVHQPRTRSSSRAEATHCRMSQRATTCSSLQPLRLRTWSWRGVRVFFRIQMCRKRFRLIFKMPKLPSAMNTIAASRKANGWPHLSDSMAMKKPMARLPASPINRLEGLALSHR